MNMVYVYKAHPIGDNDVEGFTISAIDTMPELLPGQSFDFLKNRFIEEGDKLFDVLINTLPQGTMDQLLIRLLDHKRSLFIVKA